MDELQSANEQTQVAIESLGCMISNLAQKISSQPSSHANTGEEEDMSNNFEIQGSNIRRGQSKSRGMPGLFPWVKQEVLQMVISDSLEPKQLIWLRNPDSKIMGEDVVEEQPTTIGGVQVEYEKSTAAKNSAFVKAIPNLSVFTHLWSTYAGIWAYYLDDPSLGPALMQFLGRIVDLNTKYVWHLTLPMSVVINLGLLPLRSGIRMIKQLTTHTWTGILVKQEIERQQYRLPSPSQSKVLVLEDLGLERFLAHVFASMQDKNATTALNHILARSARGHIQ